MSEVADNLRPRRGMVKPAGTLGFGPSTVRGYDEPARRTGRVLPSPDPYFTVSYSARGSYDWSSSITQDSDSLIDATAHFISALKALRLGL
jgi:hypothetical protein